MGHSMLRMRERKFQKGDFVMLKHPDKWRKASLYPVGVVTSQPRTSDTMMVRQCGKRSINGWSQSFWVVLEPEAIRELSKHKEYAKFFKTPLPTGKICKTCKRPWCEGEEGKAS